MEYNIQRDELTKKLLIAAFPNMPAVMSQQEIKYFASLCYQVATAAIDIIKKGAANEGGAENG